MKAHACYGALGNLLRKHSKGQRAEDVVGDRALRASDLDITLASWSVIVPRILFVGMASMPAPHAS